MLGAVPPSACELSERRVSCGMVGGGQEVLGWGRQLAATEERLLELQSHYHSLVDISMELIEALESAVSGRMITADYVHHLCSRLLGGAAESEGSDVKASVMRASVTALRESLQVAPAIPSRADSNLLALDFTKVKNHLACSSDMCKALLLQALRWRLTRSLTGSQRLGVLSSYVQNDILGLASDAEGGEHRQVTLALMTSEHPQLREQMARLLNSLSSLSGGRSYLSKCSALVQVLCQVLVLEKSDSLARRNALGAVQKLSLRHHLQTLMIEAGLIRWVVDVLGEPDLLCDYSLRYSLALLMNLCLRSAGRNSCIPFGCVVLKALCSLLEHADHEICSYVNGSLYSLLSLPCLREEAKRMGFDRLFSSALQSSPVDIKSQIKYLLEMLSSDKDAESSESGEEAEEDDEEEDPELIEGDEDEADVEGGDGQVSGETLLVQYLMSNGSTHSSYQTSSTVNKTLELPAFYTRPTTPQSFSIRPLTAVYSRPMSIGPTLCVAKRPVSSAT